MSFEGIDDEAFGTPGAFCQTFMGLAQDALQISSVADDAAYIASWVDETVSGFMALSRHITRLCKDRKVVLMIDEIDKSSNYQVVITFLGMLRDKYLRRKDGPYHTFQSVILAGVHDIKNIKFKMIQQGKYSPRPAESAEYNSPWNIAADYAVDMSFNSDDIATMLTEYEADYHTGMDIAVIAREIHEYSGGYPFLVSRLCKLLDEKLDRDWSTMGVQSTVKLILGGQNTPFDDIIKNLEADGDLYQFIYELPACPELRLHVIRGKVVQNNNPNRQNYLRPVRKRPVVVVETCFQ
jgi:hypothetical protein